MKPRSVSKRARKRGHKNPGLGKLVTDKEADQLYRDLYFPQPLRDFTIGGLIGAVVGPWLRSLPVDCAIYKFEDLEGIDGEGI